MRRNLEAGGGLILAERIMIELGKHIGRQEAHDVIYEAAMEAFEKRAQFGDVLKHDHRVTKHLSLEVIDKMLDPLQYLGLSSHYVDRVVSDGHARAPNLVR